LTQTFVATPTSVWHTLTYNILNGVLPTGFTLNGATGVLSGTPGEVRDTTTYQFTIRVIETYGTATIGFADRTFAFNVVGVDAPTFVTPAGPLYPGPTYLPDSTWDPYQILINNPDPDNIAVIRVVNGALPDGLEINTSGLIRGYADPSNTNYTFTLEIVSASGTALEDYSIQVVQQTTGTRAPAILNTRPPSYTIPSNDPNLPFYLGSTGNIGVKSQDNYFIFRVIGDSFSSGPLSYSRTGSLPPGVTDNINYNNTNVAITITNGGSLYLVGDTITIPGSNLGGINTLNDLQLTVTSVDTGSITGLTVVGGLNVDSDTEYTGVVATGGSGSGAIFTINKINASWILGTITADPTLLVETYTFEYTAINNFNSLTSDPIEFVVTVVVEEDNIPFDTTITWVTPSDLGTINNGTVSTLAVEAVNAGGLPLEYTLLSGTLPTALTLNSDGTISGTVAWEVESTLTPLGTLLPYTFTIQAQNVDYPELTTEKTFTLNVLQKFTQPYDNIYIRSYFSIPDRLKLNSLLQDEYLIPQEYLYRPFDENFGKATDVVYQHMYGVNSSLITQYITAVDKNHYRRSLILGPLDTAQAKAPDGSIIYEVVYSKIIDNLVNNDGVSISKSITWPRPINGVNRILYPASLDNMREQVSDVLGQDTQSALLPLWMSSQQKNGNILGYVPAWVICYCKPGYAEIVRNNILSQLPDQITIISTSSLDNSLKVSSTAGYYTGMRVKFSGPCFGGITPGVQYYVFSILTETEFTITTSMYTTEITLSTATGDMTMEQADWAHTLNELDFKIDKFVVGKSLTYEFDPATGTWIIVPSGVDPTDSNDSLIFFKKNILSNT
jgi:hypothetical protein